MRRPGLALLVVGLLIVASSASAAIACGCPRYRSAQAQYDAVDFLFVGRVVTASRGVDRDGLPAGVARFAVSQTLKGPSEATRSIRHGLAVNGLCGIDYVPGRVYLVAAVMAPHGGPLTNKCLQPQFPVGDFEKIAKRK